LHKSLLLNKIDRHVANNSDGLCVCAALLSVAAFALNVQKGPADLVDPLVGTANEGQTYLAVRGAIWNDPVDSPDAGARREVCRPLL